eukprot:2501169-Rhodomonas_salina.1
MAGPAMAGPDFCTFALYRWRKSHSLYKVPSSRTECKKHVRYTTCIVLSKLPRGPHTLTAQSTACPEFVGAGAIGCEMLKNWALMGLGCGPG